MNRIDASLLRDVLHSTESSEDADRGETAKGPVASQQNVGSQQNAASEQVDALRAHTVFVPMHYEPNYQYPLLVWLHSDGFNENQVCHVIPHISTRNYLAVGVRATQATDAAGHRFRWHESGSGLAAAERGVWDAIERAREEYNVHSDRIVLAGYQRGGAMALRIALRHPDFFSAAISLGGNLGSLCSMGLDVNQLRERRLPMLWQWSLQSSTYDEARLVEEIKSAMDLRARLEIRQYRNDDEMNTAVLSDLNQWIMNHVVSGAPVGKMGQWDSSPVSFSEN
ncbi:MAG: alpha/beta hydrolase-fold protein [Planctomycetota bacterium]